MDFLRNNLDKATSPYLQQHKNNPIHWQDWSSEVTEHAKKQNKLIFVSVGYATCHWCHVMASEAFQDKEISDFLNKHFVSIKVDREQRPDIDHYLMSFIMESQGHGGWPLNVILSPDFKPIVALTYLPIKTTHGMPGFLDFLKTIKSQFENKKDIPNFNIRKLQQKDIEEENLIKLIELNFDEVNYGFGRNIKFPPHNTLLFLLTLYEKTKDPKIKEILIKTLDIIMLKGLHDHLQGGFYRYCTDPAWTIPHFEKMLYDQAMLLWVYSFAYKVFKKEEYKKVTEKIIKCLEETFEEDGLFYSAHDADTEHEEGTTYIWTLEELKTLLGQEFDKFTEVYDITETGNFESKNHLIKKKNIFLDNIENKILEVRKKRKQPFTDKKIITSWNSLLGISFLIAYRFTANENAKIKALKLFERLIDKHYIDNKLYHSSLENKIQKQEFLEDYASFLTLATYIYEDTNEYRELIEKLFDKLKEFKEDVWYESKNKDFMKVPAQISDHPTPSSVSLAEFAILRKQILLNEDFESESYKNPLEYDFFNLAMFIKRGNAHIIHNKKKIDWGSLPLNTIQVKSNEILDCYDKKCSKFEDVKSLLKSLKT